MLADFHFLRPWWGVGLVPVFFLLQYLWRKSSKAGAWNDVCDSHLLRYLIDESGKSYRRHALLWLAASAIFMLISLAGPTWSRYPVPTYESALPRVLLLDLSDNMLARDLSPSRLSRAKFKLHDLFMRKNSGQFGLVVYTGEPFVVSPLTDDGNTIDSLLTHVDPNVMPVAGNRLDAALIEAKKLIKNADFNNGQVLVVTGSAPSSSAISMARDLDEQGIVVSIMPVVGGKNSIASSFSSFARAGGGNVITFTDDAHDLDEWLAMKSKTSFNVNWHDEIPVWRDEGRWFLIPALLFLLPAFRRGWLQRLDL